MIIETIKGILIPRKEYIFGVSDMRGLLDKKYSKYPFGISIGRKLDDRIIDEITQGPTLQYYNHYNQINNELSAVAHKIESELRVAGVNAVVIEPTVHTESKEFEKYLKTLTVEVSHKMVATRAGLGWIGKTDLFISKTFGPRLRLVSLLIDKEPGIRPKPVDKSYCGKCTACVDKCPAGAATGQLWNIHIHRDTFFNPHKCREKCGELAQQRLNVKVRICGLCVAVCPLGAKLQKY
jgi:epoxyqueuosine reductase